jgi:arginyl-tRNA synthetase
MPRTPSDTPFQPLSDALTVLLREAASRIGDTLSVPLDPVVATSDAHHGDYQSNMAFKLAKVLHRSPRDLAFELVAALPTHPLVEAAEPAGAGFVNFRLSAAGIALALEELAVDPGLGIRQEGAGRRAVIDYGSPNVAKRMHVGHLRSTNIGSALAGMHRAAGWDVVGDNHVGDWGTQFGKLIVAWRRWVDAAAFERDGIGELQRLYELFARRAEADSSLLDEARTEVARLQQGDPENRSLWKRFVDTSMFEFNKVYDRMGIRFEAVLGESFYEPWLLPLVEELLSKGLAEVHEGATLVRFTDLDGEGLASSPLLVRKTDGATLYGTTDLAAIRYREQTWKPQRILYVTDSRQQLHFRQVFALARRAGFTTAELVHVGFGVISLPEGAMSSREGNVVKLTDLLDEAARRARAIVDEKSPELPDAERAAIAEAVGVSAVRYADLSQHPSSNVVFEWDRMLAMDGNTAPFLLYSLARCRSIQRKAGTDVSRVTAFDLAHPLERDLGLALLRFPEALRAALSSYRPNLLCDHLFGLAGAFNRFYYALPVLRAEPEQRESRLSLVETTARVLTEGFRILGLAVLDRM